MTVRAASRWATNGHLIADVARVGYLNESDYVLDATYGRGTWWTYFQPRNLVAHDIRKDGIDFRSLPHQDDLFDVVAFDPPYKLNGTPTPEVDDRYGVGEPTRWQDRMELIVDGFRECCRVVKPRGYVLAKCQDQVCSGKVRWQTHELTLRSVINGVELVDAFLMLGGRAQPNGRAQVHAHRNYSTLLIFRKQRP